MIGMMRSALLAVAFFTLLLGLAYPLAMTGMAQVLWPEQANGSLVRDASGTLVGSRLIAQPFAAAGYFHPRPSAVGYDGGASGGSNLGPTSSELISSVSDRTAAYRRMNGLMVDAFVPVDAVTASASGLDPHISVANALLQAPRVAEARGLDAGAVRSLIDEHTDGRSLGVLGEPGVNVLTLNLALDNVAPIDGGA